MSAIFEHAVDAMLVLDGELTIRALNPSAERLLQWSAADVVGGLECRQVLSCRRDSPWFLSDAARGECVCAAALHRAVAEAEVLMRPRPGQSRLVAISGTPLPPGFGHDRGVFLVLRPLVHSRRLLPTELGAGPLRLDVDRHEARVGERRIHLTPIEFALLRYLLINRERVVSRQELLEHVWKYHFDDGADVVRVHIGSLRHALKEAGVNGVRIANTYGVGYMLTTQQ